MRSLVLNRWAYKDDLEGLLFFAQAVEESLFDYTIDTFRTPTLNTYYRCLELLHAVEQVEHASLHVNTLSPMVEELCESFDKDSVATTLIQSDKGALIRELRRRATIPAELTTVVKLLYGRLRAGYRKGLEARLSELVRSGKEKREITNLSRAWVTHMVNESVAPGHIFYTITQRFYSHDATPKITDPSEIAAFFKSFDAEPAGWEVIVKVSPSFAILPKVAKALSISLTNAAPAPTSTYVREKEFLASAGPGVLFARVADIRARDPVTARTRAEDVLTSAANLGFLHSHRSALSWEPEALVYDLTTKWVTHLGEPPSHALKRPDCPVYMIDELTGGTLEILQRANFDQPSTTRLLRVLDLHAQAIKSPRPETQLLNLWSAIETLLPPPRDAGRITHILGSASPLLCRAYPVKLIRYLLDNVRGELAAKADAILAKVPQGGNHFERVAALVALKENEKFRDKLYALCSPNPLLRYRIFTAFRKLSSAPAIRDTIEGHRRRVEWQVQRIYRSRNLLLHTGATLPYLGSLVENVHGYLDRMLDLVRHALKHRPHLRNLDETLLDIGLAHTSHLELLANAGSAPCAPETFLKLLFGPVETVAAEQQE